MIEQQELDFSGKRQAARPHHRATTLTTTWQTYRKLNELDSGVPVTIEFVNDEVSTTRGCQSSDHHPIRRRALLARQYKGGFRKVRVRAMQGVFVECVMLDTPVGAEDSCSCFIRVCKPLVKGAV